MEKRKGGLGVWYDELFTILEEEQDEEQAVKMSAYMKNLFPFLGIPKPKLEKLAKPFVKEAAKREGVDWDFINLCWEKEYREAQYVGTEYIIKVQKKLTYDDLEGLKRLIITKSWWDITDTLDNIVGELSLRYPLVHKEMLLWSTADNIWLRRVAIDYQQKLKEKTDTLQLEQIIVNNLGSTEFFINKAIRWSLRDYSKVNPAWVADFLTRYNGKMARLSVKEASKYL